MEYFILFHCSLLKTILEITVFLFLNHLQARPNLHDSVSEIWPASPSSVSYDVLSLELDLYSQVQNYKYISIDLNHLQSTVQSPSLKKYETAKLSMKLSYVSMWGILFIVIIEMIVIIFA